MGVMTKSSSGGHASGRGGRGKPWQGAGGGQTRSGPPAAGRSRGGPRPSGRGGGGGGAGLWFYGTHAVIAALRNPARYVHEIRATTSGICDLPADLPADRPKPRLCEGAELAQLLPPGAVHQGLAARVEPLDDVLLQDVLEPAAGLLVMLDQVSDPQNVGAIFRTAAAFGVRAVIQQDRHSPQPSGALAKAAAGAAEIVADVRVVNLSQTIATAQKLGWRVVGLAGEAGAPLDTVLDGAPTLLVMGGEGRGLRELVARNCDVLARIEIDPAMESLNVSVATGIALAFAARHHRRA
jgi:23S rRNA (guanosine2251-2'-O)-methyltransferase